MFKSIEYLECLEYNKKTNIYSYLFKIIDDDFEEGIKGAGDRRDTGAGATAVITCYENKNLNVPKNLLKLFIFYERRYGTKHHSIQQQISWCLKYQPLFLKYENEVEKYLSLL